MLVGFPLRQLEVNALDRRIETSEGCCHVFQMLPGEWIANQCLERPHVIGAVVRQAGLVGERRTATSNLVPEMSKAG